MKKGNLFILSGPSGIGKDTVLGKLLAVHDDIRLSISSVTRNMRDGEVDGEKYNFISRAEFEQMIENDELLEYNEYLGNYYGTPKKPVYDMLNRGFDVILEIDVNGADKVARKAPEAVRIFMMPRSIEVLYQRLKKRGTEDEETIRRRVAQAVREMAAAERYDYVFVNDRLEDAVNDFYAIIRANALLKENMNDFINEVNKNAQSFHC